MAIITGDSIEKFGTQDTVTAAGGTSAVASGAFSVTADAQSWTNTDDAPRADMVLNGSFGVAPDTSSVVNIYARKMNVDGVSDSNVPDLSNKNLRIGSFNLDSGQIAHVVTTEVLLPNAYSSQVYEFYFENQSGQSMTAGWVVKITPKADGPAA